MSPSAKVAAVARFRALHAAGCFLLPNPWDAGSTRFLEHLGFPAVATTSAGFAFTRGLPDSPEAVPLEMMLGHFREIVAATTLPVNADFLNGYADAPDGVAANVRSCVERAWPGCRSRTRRATRRPRCTPWTSRWSASAPHAPRSTAAAFPWC